MLRKSELMRRVGGDAVVCKSDGPGVGLRPPQTFAAGEPELRSRAESGTAGFGAPPPDQLGRVDARLPL